MNHFFDTMETALPGLAMSRFCSAHLAWLVIAAALMAGFTWLYCRLDDRRRDFLRIALGIAAAVIGLTKQVCLFAAHVWHPAYLPVCFCSFGLLLVILHAWKNSEFVGNILYTVYLPLSLVTLISPYWLVLPAKNFLCWYYFLSHILLAVYPLMLVVGGTLRPRLHHAPRIAVLSLAVLVPLFALDATLDLNFFYLMSAPTGHFIDWFTHHCGSHLVGYPVLLALLFTVSYGGYALVRLIFPKKET